MSKDYWYWFGGMLRDGCGSTGPPYESWIVPGHRSGRLRDATRVPAHWQIWLPLVMARKKVLISAAVNVLGMPESAPTVSCRAALYRSRGNACAYPGELLRDLGTATRITPGIAGFVPLAPLELDGGQLLWAATWWSGAALAPTITTAATAEAGAYPVLGYDGPTDLVPRCGWAGEVVYAPAEESDWPNPPGLALQTIDIAGQIHLPPTQLALPSLYLLFGAPLT